MATLASMTVRLGIDADQLRRGAQSAMSTLGKLSKGVAALGGGVPAVAATTAAVGGMASAFASAGIAAKAFQVAAGPQLEAVAEAANLAEKAQEAAAKGGEEAAKAQQEYNDALAAMPPATRTMAKEFIGLKKQHEKWSDSLSSTTMPVFTKGIKILRALLPKLTPFVEAAADAFGGFLDEVAAGVKSKGFEKWAATMSEAAGPALKNFLTTIKNFAMGFGALVGAFAGQSDNVTGGLVSMSAAFRDWATSLQGSEGFAQFLDLARQAGPMIGELASAAMNLLIALGPLIGITTQVALALAKVVNALPPGVLEALATAIVGAVVAWKAYKAVSDTVSKAQDLLNSRAGQAAKRWAQAAGRAIASWARMAGRAVASAARVAAAWAKAAARSIASMARIAARAALSAARTAAVWAASAARMAATWLAQMIRVAAVTVARFAMMAARAVIWAATMAAQWLIAMGPVGWIIAIVIGLVALIIANWDKIKAFTVAAWNWIWTKIKQFAKFIVDFFMNWTIVGRIIKHWDEIKAKTKAAWNAIVSWVKAIPGRLWSSLSSMGSKLANLAMTAWRRFRAVVVARALSAVAWVRGLPGRMVAALGNLGGKLWNAGQSLIRGFINGIKSMIGSVKSTLGNITSSLTSWKGPPRVDARILTPAGISLLEGFQRGIAAQVPYLRRQLQDVTGDLPGMTADVSGVRAARRAGAAGPTLNVNLNGAPGWLKQAIREIVSVQGRGDVQFTFGRG